MQSMLLMPKNQNLAKELAYKSSFLMGYELKNIGVDVNFSPVCDIFFNEGHGIIGDRSFGSNPHLVKDLSQEFCRGLSDSGIVPVPKHFPGHGRSIHDTHEQSSIVDVDFNTLLLTDLIPFHILNKSLMVMIAHIIYQKIDRKIATYSKKIINELLKNQLKFRGLVLSDDISMNALDGSLEKRVKKTYESGCDVILYCNGNLNEMLRIYPFIKKIKKNLIVFFFNELKKIKNNKIRMYNQYKEDLLKNKIIGS